MRVAVRAILLAGLVSACSLVGDRPSAMKPTFKALAHLGYSCDAGEKELGPPNGLYQWHCNRANKGPAMNVLVEGNDRDVATFIIGIDDTNPAHVRQEFSRILAEVPPISSAPWIADGLDGWTGPQASRVVHGIRVTGVCDATQCMVFISNAADPIEPLPLP
jgi:hypothetical protein